MTTTAENQDMDPAGEAGKRVREESRIRGGGSMEPIVAYDPLHGPTVLRSPGQKYRWFVYEYSRYSDSSWGGDAACDLERLPRLANGRLKKSTIVYARDVAAVGRRNVPPAANASKRTWGRS
ncbi:hypothetical protein LIA77_03273 [Sarocladium implicatum]|nr:hypothetical protein LIA77_03273 [Sarocladium implicatum]